MTLEYKINEQDFLDFLLFTASKSDRINKQRRKGWVFLIIGSIAIAFYFYLNDNTAMTVSCGIVALAFRLFYPKYFNWRYKKYYKTYIKKNYSKRFGQVTTLKINNDSIYFKDKLGEAKIILSQVERVDETANHFFLKISTGLSLVLPKKELKNPDRPRERLQNIGLKVNDETNWNWK